MVYVGLIIFVCIKVFLCQLPVIGQTLTWGKHILVDRGKMSKRMDVIDQSAECIRNNYSICMFPEGTRSSLPNGEMLSFQKGAFLVAQMTGAKIVPLSLSRTGEVMPSSALLPLRPGRGRLRLHVHPSVEAKGKSLEEVMHEVKL